MNAHKYAYNVFNYLKYLQILSFTLPLFILVTSKLLGAPMTKYNIPPILRFEDLQNLFKISRSTLARWEKRNKFPLRVHIGENSIGWRSDEVHQWLQERSQQK